MITIPDQYWVYLCQVFATVDTPIMQSVGATGIVNNLADMSELGREVSFYIPNGNKFAQAFFTWINLQTNTSTPAILNTALNDISNTIYPIAIPDSDWLYIAKTYATERTRTLTKVGNLGYVQDAFTMLLLFSDLTLVLQNGNPSMNRFFDWCRFARNGLTVDDPGNDLSLLESY